MRGLSVPTEKTDGGTLNSGRILSDTLPSKTKEEGRGSVRRRQRDDGKKNQAKKKNTGS